MVMASLRLFQMHRLRFIISSPDGWTPAKIGREWYPEKTRRSASAMVRTDMRQLVGLGLVERVRGRRGYVYRVTPRGRTVELSYSAAVRPVSAVCPVSAPKWWDVSEFLSV